METAYFKDIRKHIISLLNEAKDEVIVAMAWFTNRELFDALLECCSRNVKVKLLLLDDAINFNPYAPDFNLLINAGAEFRLYTIDCGFMHHKFCIIDRHILITGSYNWTYYAETRNIENIFVSDKPQIAQLYSNEFSRLCKKIDTTKFSPRLSWEEIENISNINFEELNYEIETIAKVQNIPQRTVYKSHTTIEVVKNRHNPKSRYNIGIIAEENERFAIIPIDSELPFVSKDVFPNLKSYKSERATSKLVIAAWSNEKNDSVLMQRSLSDILNQTDEVLSLLINGNLDSNGSLHIEIRCKETGKAVDLSIRNINLIKDEN